MPPPPPPPPPPPRRAISTQSTRAGGRDVAQVSVLQQDKRWRFQWSEVAFLQLWWKNQSPAKREAFKTLVKSGQLELTGGGLVMNDEALTTLFAIIENVNEGRRWIEETVGVTVDTSWQNDPFGLSATMAYLYSKMDYTGMWIQRVHYRVKAYLAHERSFEFWWRQHGDTKGSTDIYTHMNPFYAYDVPHTCGPEP
jgi:alpha-mannosidase II